MELTEGSAVLVLTEHSPLNVNADADTPRRRVKITCLCNGQKYSPDEFAAHQAGQLAFVAEVVQETVAEPVIRCSCGHRKERHAGGYMGCSKPLCLCMEFRR